MAKTLDLIAADDTTITINRPTWGYTCEIHMPITAVEKHPSGYSFYDADPTGSLDYRVLTTARWQLPTSQKQALNAFLRDADLGRAETITMRLGSDPTGFYPYGPDYGDVGDFSVRLLGQQQGGMLLAPLKYWQDDLWFVLVPPAPSYAHAAGVSQGKFSIGTVGGLMYPQNTFNPTSQYTHQTEISRTGVPYSIDGREASDSWETSWEQQCNAGKAADLIAYLTATAQRTADITVTGLDNYFVFGADQGSVGTYYAKFLGSSRSKNEVVISVTHEHNNQFTIPLSFYLIGKQG